MKALILAAGKGSRLGKISETLPKPMIKFKGIPILEHNILLCKKYGVTELYINTSHLAHIIQDYFGDGSKWGVNITYSFETELLGTSGALNSFKEKIGKDDFFVIYGDNYSEVNLENLLLLKNKKNALASIAFHYREDVSMSGVAEFDKNSRIASFIEKPKPGTTTSHWVNAGVYYCENKILSEIPDGFSDFAKDIFPKILANSKMLLGLCDTKDVIAFDTVELLKQNI